MKIDLGFNEKYVVEVDLQVKDDDSKLINVKNRELPDEDQIKAIISFATNSQMYASFQSYSVQSNKFKDETRSYNLMDFERSVKKHVHEIFGLEDFKINNGNDLVAHPTNPTFNRIIKDLFLKVNGLKDEDNLSEKK